MTTIEETPTPPPPDEVRELRRSRENRWIAGVCGGLAEYFGLNAAIYRVLFVALALAGGTGILLYLAAAVVMPDAGAKESFLSETLRRHRNRPWLVIGLALLALVLVSIVSEPGFDFGWIVLAGVVGLIIWGVRGGGRRLALVLALVLAVVLGVIGAAVGFAQAHGGFGDIDERPLVASELDDRYELGAGEIDLDLSELEVPTGETHVEVDVGFGEINVIVPSDVAVSADAEVKWGEASVLGHESDGRHVVERFSDPGFDDADRRLVIDARVRAGELNISR